MRTIATAVVLVGSLLLGVCVGRAQDLEEFWKEVRTAVEAGNFQSLKKLIELNPSFAEASFWRAVDHYTALESQGKLEDARKSRAIMEQLGNAFYMGTDDRDFMKYAQFIVRLNLIQKGLWNTAFGKYYDFMGAYFKADAPKEPVPDDVKAALALYEEPFQEMEGLDDFYLQGMLQKCAGVLYAKLGKIDEAKRAFEIATACFSTFDSQKQTHEIEGFVASLEQIRRSQEAEKARKERELEEKGISKEGETPWEKIQLRYRSDPKGLPGTGHPYTVDDYLLWYRVLVPEKDPVNFYESFESNASMWTSYYKDVFGRWPSQSSLLFSFMLVQDKKHLTLDLNDDGRVQPEERLKVTSKPKVIELEGLHTKDGKPFDYAMEMINIGEETWFGQPNSRFANPGQMAIGFRRACHREGRYKGKKLILVDDNSNGSYGDVGADSLYLEGEEPCFLGKLMRLGGEIVQVRVQGVLGEGVNIRPWKGETGLIETKWKGKTAPAFLFVRGLEEEVTNAIFALDLKSPVVVPAGTYKFYFGMIRSGKGRQMHSVEIRAGDASSFEVKPNETFSLALGAPFTIAFKVTEEPETYLIRGRDLEYHGASGELYTRFTGKVPRPKLQVRREKGGVVAKGTMRKVEYEDRVRDAGSVWYPKDFEIAKSKAGKNATFLAKFTVDSKLLGPIKTGWIKAK